MPSSLNRLCGPYPRLRGDTVTATVDSSGFKV